MEVISSLKSRLVRLPVTSSVDLVAGSLMIQGLSTAQPLGGVMVGAATSAAGTYVGILAEKFDYAKNGSALATGAVHSAVISGAGGAAWFAPAGGNKEIFPSKLIELIEGITVCRIDYATTGVAVESSSSTTVTLTALEDNIDTAFLYSSAGEAIGEMRFVSASADGSCTTSNAFTTMTSAGYIVKIVPLLHGLVVLTVGNTTTPTKIDTTAAAGAARMVQLERHIVRDGVDEMMDPYTHGNLSGLNSLGKLELYGVFGMASTVFQPLS